MNRAVLSASRKAGCAFRLLPLDSSLDSSLCECERLQGEQQPDIAITAAKTKLNLIIRFISPLLITSL